LLIGEDEVKKKETNKKNTKQDSNTSPVYIKDKIKDRKSDPTSSRMFTPASQCINIEKAINSRNFTNETFAN